MCQLALCASSRAVAGSIETAIPQWTNSPYTPPPVPCEEVVTASCKTCQRTVMQHERKASEWRMDTKCHGSDFGFSHASDPECGVAVVGLRLLSNHTRR